jgi:hypothetical protein
VTARAGLQSCLFRRWTRDARGERDDQTSEFYFIPLVSCAGSVICMHTMRRPLPIPVQEKLPWLRCKLTPFFFLREMRFLRDTALTGCLLDLSGRSSHPSRVWSESVKCVHRLLHRLDPATILRLLPTCCHLCALCQCRSMQFLEQSENEISETANQIPLY